MKTASPSVQKPYSKPSARAEIIDQRTYCRPLDDGDGFETHEEQIARVIDHQRWLWRRAKAGMTRDEFGRWVLADLDADEEAELGALQGILLDRRGSMAGRTHWLGGTDIAKQREASQLNPLPRSTRFVTAAGVRSFEDFEDGDAVDVLTHLGRTRPARVMRAGVRDTVRLNLRRGRTEFSIDSCAGHTWITLDGRKTTDDLVAGDRMVAAPLGDFYAWDFWEAPEDEQLWWCYGFVYGDGSVARSGKSETSRVRLCGDKSEYLPRFTACAFGHSNPPSFDGEPYVYTGRYLKSLPEGDVEPRMAKAFLRGYLDADGNKKNQRGETRFTGISCSDPEAADFVARWAPLFGLYVLYDKEVERETNFGTFAGRRLSFTTSSRALLWKVDSVETGVRQEVWCLTVEDDRSFVLENSLVSGNCAFTEVRSASDVVDVLWLLLQGCGVGFRPVPGMLNGFSQPVEISVVRSERGPDEKGREKTLETYDAETRTWTIAIGDSAEAWARAAGKLVGKKPPALRLRLDLSEIRGAGHRLSGYGWISSGDEAIARAFTRVAELMSDAAGRLLTTMEILDVVNWLGTILSSRRSAQIALVDYGSPEWYEFAVGKRDHWTCLRCGSQNTQNMDCNDCGAENCTNGQRQQSNNSVVFHARPSYGEIRALLDMMVAAGGSEPGIVNAEASLARAPYWSGTNPCLAGDTLVPVNGRGLVRIDRLADQDALVRDGVGSIVRAKGRMTQRNAALYELRLSDGSRVRATANHEFVVPTGGKIRLDELTPGVVLKASDPEGMFGSDSNVDRAYLDGWLIADGTWHNDADSSKLQLYAPKFKRREALEQAGATFNTFDPDADRNVAYFAGYGLPPKEAVPRYVLEGDRETAEAFVRGYFEADGHVSRSSSGIQAQVCSVHESFLLDLQALLKLFGVRSSVSSVQPAGHRELPDGRGGSTEYECREVFRLVVSNAAKFVWEIDRDGASFGVACLRGPYKTSASGYVTVVSVEDTGENEDVYCLGVPTTASFDLATVHSGNCAEILLPNKGFCNLVELNVSRYNGDTDGLVRDLRVLARANYRQTCVDFRDGVLTNDWHETNDFLHLCGVGLTGIVAWEGDADTANGRALRLLARETATASAEQMAQELGLPLPKNVTTVKPSGTRSKVSGTVEYGEVPEGCHNPLGRYIFNWVEFDQHDERLPAIRLAGYETMRHPYKVGAELVKFPVEYTSPEIKFTHKTLSDGREVEVMVESALDQIKRYLRLQRDYVDHNTSITISYSPDEVPIIAKMIHRHWDRFVSASFLFRNDPTKTAADLGYPYLPQEVTDEKTFRAYQSKLKPMDLSQLHGTFVDEECSTGACPIR